MDTAMMNETLCKLLCHNICYLIQSFYELGVMATFWGESQPRRESEQLVFEEDGIEAMAWT
jgi:hypothetical protein